MRKNIEAGLVLLAIVLLLLFVPHEWLRPISAATVAIAIPAVFGIRAYRRRLEGVIQFMASAENAQSPEIVSALLTPHERRILGMNRGGTAAEIVERIRRKQSLITGFGILVGVTGLCAFILLIILYSD